MTQIERFRTQQVTVVVPDRGQLVGTLGFYEALDAANRFRMHRGLRPAYQLTLAGLHGATVSAAGITVATVPTTAITATEVLVVGGSRLECAGSMEPALIGEVDRLAPGATRVVSLCLGAFALGAIGLLDGRPSTTHWMALELLKERFPNTQVERDAIFTEHESVFTSAGATAAVDLALHLIRKDLGSKMALLVARSLVVFAQRPGGQSQFGSAIRLPAGADERIEALIAGIIEDPCGDHRVESLACRAGMSTRHFARVFREQTRFTPAYFVVRARVEAAQRSLVQSDASLEQIAESCGLGTAATLRRSFRRVVGVSPTAYRARFRTHSRYGAAGPG